MVYHRLNLINVKKIHTKSSQKTCVLLLGAHWQKLNVCVCVWGGGGGGITLRGQGAK